MKTIKDDDFSVLQCLQACTNETIEALNTINGVFDPSYDVVKMTNNEMTIALVRVKEKAAVFSVVQRALENHSAEISVLLEKIESENLGR